MVDQPRTTCIQTHNKDSRSESLMFHCFNEASREAKYVDVFRPQFYLSWGSNHELLDFTLTELKLIGACCLKDS